YMAHHQAMILLALDNGLNGDVHVRRFHADPRAAAFDLLLDEGLPASLPPEEPWRQDGAAAARVQAPAPLESWTVPAEGPLPRTTVLSNGRYAAWCAASGGGGSRRLAVTSCAEVVLAPPAEDRRHPAFVKLFVESEHLPELSALHFRRRPRSLAEEHVHLVHAAVFGAGCGPEVSFETDRARF